MRFLQSFCLLFLILSASVYSQDYDSLISRAVSARNSGDFSQAETLLREAYEIPVDKSEVSALLGMVLAFQERYLASLEIIESALEDNPGNADLLLARARILSFQGSYIEANEIVTGLLDRFPENTEALNLAGRLSLYQQQPGRAGEFFQQSLSIDPDNFEALIGLYDSEMILGNSNTAEAYLSRAESIAPENIDVLSRRNPATYTAGLQHELILGYGQSSFDRFGFPQWHDRYIEYRYTRADSNQLYGRINHDHHFNLHDTMLEAGVLLGQNTSLPVELSLGYTSDARFLPEYFFRVGTSHLLLEGSDNLGSLLINGQYQQSSYLNGMTRRISIGLEYYLLNANAWLTPSFGVVRDQDGEETFSASLGAHWQITGLTRIGLSYSDAPETENLITTDTSAVAAYVLQTLSDRISLTASYARSSRENSYTRSNYSLALSFSF